MTHFYPRFVVTALILLASVLGSAKPVLAATPQQIDKSIADGVQFIWGSQKADGTWEPPTIEREQHGAVTSMCVYALLMAGEKDTDPRLAKAIQYLLKADIRGTYAMGFQALALDKLTSTPAVKAALQKTAKRLIQGAERGPGAIGHAVYMYDDAGDYWDNSNGQYNVLGVWACADAGVEIPDKYWEEVDKAWRASVLPDGGWGYNADAKESRLTMDDAGVATLFITDDALAYKNPNDCKGNISDKVIENGIKCLTPKLPGPFDLYALYGVSRIGLASGYKYFGTYDWFKEGAAAIVKAQKGDGSWNYYSDDVGTAYAIMFLVRGRAPIVMNKLRYQMDPTVPDPVDGNWNQRPRDAAGAAKFIGTQLETLMNWQVVTLEVDPDEFHDSPILYLAGYNLLKFTPEQEAKLRRFVEDGGLLLGNADCGSSAFARSFKDLCKKLFDGKYEFRPLPVDHPVFTHEQFPAAKWSGRPLVEGMSNGVRELAMLVPTSDPAKLWAHARFKADHQSFELMADIYLYSVDRQNITQKGDTYIVKANPNINAIKTLKVARLQYDGEWDPEPGAWRRLAAIFHNSKKIDLAVTPVKLGSGQLASYTIAALTGAQAIHLDDASRAEIKSFIQSGGTLIIDAAGGSESFSDSIQKELAQIFPDQAAQLQTPLPASSPLLSGGEIKYRSIVRSLRPGVHGADIRTIEVNNRSAIIFSPEDITAGLVGEPMDGIVGYTPETALRLMTSFIMDTLPHAPATTQSATAPSTTKSR